MASTTRSGCSTGRPPTRCRRGSGACEAEFPTGVAAPLFHVRQMGLVGLGPRRRRRCQLVLPGRQAAPRAVPQRRRLHVGGERRLRHVPIGAPVGHLLPGCLLTTLAPAHRSGAHTAATDGIATHHCWLLLSTWGSIV